MGVQGNKPEDCKAKLLNMAVAEMVYTIWKKRNLKIFAETEDTEETRREVIKMVALRCANIRLR